MTNTTVSETYSLEYEDDMLRSSIETTSLPKWRDYLADYDARRENFIEAFLAGKDEELRDIMLEQLKNFDDGNDVTQTRICADLLAHKGIDPLALSAWLMLNLTSKKDVFSQKDVFNQINGINLTERDNPTNYIRIAQRKKMNQFFAIPVMFKIGNERNLRYEEIPEAHVQIAGCNFPATVVSRLAGQKLKDVISHPVLDRHDLTIERVQEDVISVLSSNFTSQKLILEGKPEYISHDEVASIRPLAANPENPS